MRHFALQRPRPKPREIVCYNTRVENEYISLDVLAIRLRLPRSFLRRQVALGTIPCIRLPGKGRLRFDEEAVRNALRRFTAVEAPPSADGAAAFRGRPRA